MIFGTYSGYNVQELNLNLDWVKNKIADYYLTDFRQRLEHRLDILPSAITSKPFRDEMSRFLDKKTIERTLERNGFVDYMVDTIQKLLNQVLEALYKE